MVHRGVRLESGIRRRDASYYHWLYVEQVTYGSSGALFWNLGPQVAAGTYDVNPSTPLTWAEVLAH